ncbi:erythromycin esterase family protein [Halopseudomonas sp.]|uniref:erythromycin esterase family protein n=1 Tax=Halopseudomonas sp. TaxID=2901191 RepID=UPI003001C90C|tara:strand:- start:64 stop:1419 length:1356 start_codon:yes stop_codon:yes gene_type:complete
MSRARNRITEAIEEQAVPLAGSDADFDAIIDAARGKSVVLIGEASHGTREFYAARAAITQRLISELGFAAVAVEADWPDAYAINRHVWNASPERTARETLQVFRRFPTWMWANTEVLDFMDWLAVFNRDAQASGTADRPVGFYGLDLYSMGRSAEAVIEYLDRHDPGAAELARERYACLDRFADEPHLYGQAVDYGLSQSCEKAITAQLMDMHGKAYRAVDENGLLGDEEAFGAAQNAKLVRDAEEYYRTMFSGRPSSWNLRDRHMFETLEALRDHLGQQLGKPAGVVVWAHNSHIGNAAATDMSQRGEFNIGQLAKEKHGGEALLIGFSTAVGEVTAASDWDAPAERKRVRPPLEGSYEELFFAVSHERFLLDLRGRNPMTELLMQPRIQRAIGVIYRPETERQSHYFFSSLPRQYDFIIHYDETSALQALDVTVKDPGGEADDTHPSGL